MPLKNDRCTLSGKPGRYIAAVFTAAVLMVCGTASARNGRDFAGFYQIGQRTDQGDTVQIEFSLSIQNFSDAEVYGATAVLDPALLRPAPSYWRSASVTLHDRERVVLHGTATVSKVDLQQWDRGAPPRLTLEWTDPEGGARRGNVELHAGPVPEVR